MLTMKYEDDPSPLLDEWAELLQPNRINWITLLNRLEGFRSQGFQPDTKDCRQPAKFNLSGIHSAQRGKWNWGQRRILGIVFHWESWFISRGSLVRKKRWWNHGEWRETWWLWQVLREHPIKPHWRKPCMTTFGMQLQATCHPFYSFILDFKNDFPNPILQNYFPNSSFLNNFNFLIFHP